MTKGIHIAKKSPMGEKPIGQILIQFYQFSKLSRGQTNPLIKHL